MALTFGNYHGKMTEVIAIRVVVIVEGEPVPDYLTIEEAAEVLRTPVATLYQWRHHRTGPPAAKVGRRLLYERTALIRWIREQTTATAA